MRFRSQTGNGFLEVLMFLPLAFIFLFGGIDATLRLIEKGAISQILHAELNNERHQSIANRLYTVEDNQLVLNQETVEGLTQLIASKIANKIAEDKSVKIGGGDNRFRVHVTALAVNINPQTGKIDTSEGQYQKLYDAFAGEQKFNLLSVAPSYPEVSREEFLEKIFSLALSKDNFEFSIPLGISYPGNNIQTKNYLSQSLLLYGEVTAVTNGLNQAFDKATFENLFAVQQQDLVLIRG